MELVKVLCIKSLIFQDSIEFDENGYLIEDLLEIDFIKNKEYILFKDEDGYTTINENSTKHTFDEKQFKEFFKELYTIFI